MANTHHILEIPETQRKFYVPTELAYCNEREYVIVSRYLWLWTSGKINFEEFKVQCIYELLNLKKSKKQLNIIEEDFKNRIEELELVFDLDSSDILMPADFKDRPEVREGDLEIVRIEGTATQQGTERCYFDAFLFRDHKRGEVLFASSHSSVLNGLVEGPYFEEMILGAHFS